MFVGYGASAFAFQGTLGTEGHTASRTERRVAMHRSRRSSFCDMLCGGLVE